MPNFKKSRGFKMKGYSYPGTSPLRDDDFSLEREQVGPRADNIEETKPEKMVREALQVKKSSESSPKPDNKFSSEGEKKKKEKKKDEKGKIDWSSIATDAISTVVQTGAQAGIEALIRPRPNPSKNAGASGSMGGVNFGTGTSLLNNKKS